MIEDGSTWDAMVVGAGPAGAVSACLLARRGWRVLLLEKSEWPREKVCGGCVNASAVGMLGEIGLSDVVRGGTRLRHFSLHVTGKRLDVPLPEGVAVARGTLDARLVAAAEEAGVVFVSRAVAKLHPGGALDGRRTMTVSHDNRQISLHARVVLACDGISGTLLQSEPWAGWTIARDAWFGVATLLEDSQAVGGGVIGMHVGRGGYVGVVRLGGDRVHVAAALDPAACRAAGGPGRMVEGILGTPLGGAVFQGTGLLTRHRHKLGGDRVLAVGDACGYVEPFTGEGIAWAIRGAMEVVRVLPERGQAWDESIVAAWQLHHAKAVRTHWCRALRRVARWPAAARVGVIFGNIVPVIARGIGRRISGFPQLEGVVT